MIAFSELSEGVSKWLIEHGYDERMGTRPMARVIQKHVFADPAVFCEGTNMRTASVAAPPMDAIVRR